MTDRTETETEEVIREWDAALRQVTAIEDKLHKARRAKAAIGQKMRELGLTTDAL